MWSLAPIIGATVKLSFIWLLADVLNALMAIPNLIALALLSPVVFVAAREFFETRGSPSTIHSEALPGPRDRDPVARLTRVCHVPWRWI